MRVFLNSKHKPKKKKYIEKNGENIDNWVMMEWEIGNII